MRLLKVRAILKSLHYFKKLLHNLIAVVKKPPPWYAVLVVVLMGVVQAVAGAALAILSGGAFGTGLIADGVGDMVKGIKVCFKIVL